MILFVGFPYEYIFIGWNKSGYDEILSVFPDPTLKLHTTRSWEFLDSQSGLRLPVHKYRHASQDVIIGVIDTGTISCQYYF